jgi:carbon storage regulator CsrA
MLILTRRINEGVVVTDSDDNILAQVTVVKIDKNQVKLGIDTPVGNEAYRSELYENNK